MPTPSLPMASTVVDSILFRDAFGTPAMRAIFSDRAVIARYPKLREVCWVQEEPENMGAWEFARPLLETIVDGTHPRDLSEGQRLLLVLCVILAARPPTSRPRLRGSRARSR